MNIERVLLNDVYKANKPHSEEVLGFLSNHPLGKLINGDKCWLAGGSLRSLYTREKINDFDIFCSDLETVKKFREVAEKSGINMVFGCPENMLFTYSDSTGTYQIIHLRDYSSADNVMADFDFTATCQVTDGMYLWREVSAMQHILEKVLIINAINTPVSFLRRLGKYATYGYKFSGEQAEIAVRAIMSKSLEDTNFTHYVD